MQSAIEEKIRKRTKGVVLVNALKAYLAALLGLCTLYYLYAGLVFFLPSAQVITFDPLMAAGILLSAPLLVALFAMQAQGKDARNLVLTLERTYPQLKDRLGTAMEVSSQRTASTNAFSRALAKNLETEMNQIMDRFGFQRAISWNKLIAPGVLLAAIFISGSVHALLQPRFFDLSARRLASVPQPLNFPSPSKGQALSNFQLSVSPGNCEIRKNANLLVQVEARGDTPEEVQLLLKQQSDPVWRIFVMNGQGEGKFQYLLTHITEPCLYLVKSGSEQTSKYRIDLFEPLSVLQTAWNLEYPLHTTLPQESREGWGSKMTVPEGTLLHLSLQMNRPVREGKLLVQGGEDILMALEGETRLRGSFRIKNDMVVRLDIKSADGEPLMGASALWLQTLPDLPPYLEVLQPQIQNYTFPTQEIPFEINIDDDYGVAAVDLVIRARGQEKRIPWLPDNPGGPVRKTSILPLLLLEDFQLESKDIVFAFVEVKDNNPAAEHTVKSPLFTFLIRDYVEQFKLNAPDPTTPSLRSLFEDILVEQEKIMSDAWDFHSRLRSDEPQGVERPTEARPR